MSGLGAARREGIIDLINQCLLADSQDVNCQSHESGIGVVILTAKMGRSGTLKNFALLLM